jgi:hypothetical protein
LSMNERVCVCAYVVFVGNLQRWRWRDDDHAE